MHKTIYIETEDEITVIVGKIRREPADEIFLVVPKNAMLAQGLINIEILKRETEKLNKKIVFISSDKQTREFLEKLDLDVRDDLDEDFVSEEKMDDFGKSISEITQGYSSEKNQSRRTIGSQNFYEYQKGWAQEEMVQQEEDENMRFKNETRETEESRKIKVPVKDKSGSHLTRTPSLEPFSMREIKRSPVFSDEKKYSERIARKKRILPKPFPISKQKETEDFFLKKEDETPKNVFVKKERSQKSVQGGWKWLIATIISIFVLLSGGVFVFVNFPKLKIKVYPRVETVGSEIEVSALAKAEAGFGENEIKGEVREFEISQELKFQSTGEKFSSDKGKARGKVKIFNRYSSSSQPLVATTRLLSEGGKLFRLAESVVVPGMKGEQAGEIEVKVMADEPGGDFNIESSKFTIEGFKSGPKYEKFEVISSENMVGGMDDVDNQKVKVVTQDDIEKARAKVLDSFNNSLENKIKEKLGEGEMFLIDSAEKEIVESVSSEKVGDVADEFVFILKEKVKLIVFEKSDLEKIVKDDLKKKLASGYGFDENSLKIDFEKGSADFEKGVLKFEAVAVGKMISEIDENEIKKNMAGKNEQEIAQFFENYDMISKAEVAISPSWLFFLPITEGKVEISEPARLDLQGDSVR